LDRAAVFVDAGYVFAEGSKLIAGQKLPRAQLLLEYDVLLQLLQELTATLTGLPLLRVYWYDGSSGPNAAHIALAYRPNLKLRLGSVGASGQQGVDELIARDLSELSRHRAMADALLLSGDDDLRPAAELAQDHGVRLHLLGIPPARDNQAASLAQSVDTRRELSEAEVRSFLRKRSATGHA
jgi:uncharacterized LabA/DUF88 family protein